MLPQIERLTWFQVLACFTTQPFSQTGCRLFVNSIASQALSEPDIREIERLYGPYLNRLVMELTEEERPDSDAMQHKLASPAVGTPDLRLTISAWATTARPSW